MSETELLKSIQIEKSGIISKNNVLSEVERSEDIRFLSEEDGNLRFVYEERRRAMRYSAHRRTLEA